MPNSTQSSGTDSSLALYNARSGGLVGAEGFRAAAELPACPRRGQTGTCPFSDEVAFKLCQRRKEMKHQFAGPRRRIDVFLKTFEVNPLLVQVMHGLHQM